MMQGTGLSMLDMEEVSQMRLWQVGIQILLEDGRLSSGEQGVDASEKDIHHLHY